MRDLAFWGLTLCLLAAAVTVVTAKSLFRAAFALSAALVATAGFYLLLTAHGHGSPGRTARLCRHAKPIAVAVYEKVGLGMLRRAWINVDLVWAAALVVTGLFTRWR